MAVEYDIDSERGVEYDIDSERGVVTVKMTGALVDKDFVAMYERLRDDEAIRPEYSVLFDLAEAHQSQASSSGVRRLAELPLLFLSSSRRAILVCSEFGYGMARMYDGLRGELGEELKIFRDRDEARCWVGLDEG